MPPRGLTLRSMGRFTARHLIHNCVLEKWAGRGPNDRDTWTPLGVYKCRLVPAGGVAFNGTSAAQDFDAQLILGLTGGQSGQPAFDRTARYRMVVREYKTPLERLTAESGPPEIKRTYWLEMTRADHIEDNAGTDFIAVLQCRNAKQWPLPA